METLNWVFKTFRICKNESSSFPNHADSTYRGIPEFFITLNDVSGIPFKIHKILEKFVDFQACSLSIFYRISNVVHGEFSEIAQYISIRQTERTLRERFGEHRRNLTNKLTNKSGVAEHFN